MKKSTLFSLFGLLVGAIVNILINLISSAIQQKGFKDQFDNGSLIWIVVFAVIGLVVGYLLSIRSDSSEHSDKKVNINTIISREEDIEADITTDNTAIGKIDAKKKVKLTINNPARNIGDDLPKS